MINDYFHQPICDDCEVIMEFVNAGRTRGVEWIEWKCPKCGKPKSNEPDIEDRA